MFAGCCVQAGVCQAEALDGLAAEDVRVDNLVDVGFGDMSVPDCIRIDHKVGAVFALIEAPGLVRAHSALQSALGQLLLEDLLEPGFGERITAPARMARRALV